MAATEVQGPAPGSLRAAERAKQVASLTGMRGFAALMVVLIHTSGRTEYSWLGIHGYGPIALFVLSGFLLYRPWARWVLGLSERPSARAFGIRRAFRIFPAYWVVLLVWMAAYPRAVPNSPREWFDDLTLLSSTGFYTLPEGLQQVWSLGVELSWYVALPFIAIAVHALLRPLSHSLALKAHVALLLSSMPVSLAWLVWTDRNDMVDEGMWLPRWVICLGVGALIGLMLETYRAGIPLLARVRVVMARPRVMLGAAVAFAALGLSPLAGPHTFTSLTMQQEIIRDTACLGLAASLLAASVFGAPGSPVVRFMSTRVMQAAGRWSYGIYLWHLPLIVLLWEEFSFPSGPMGIVVWLSVVVGISSVLGAATFVWVEQPTMDWSRQLAARVEGARAGARRKAVEPRHPAGVLPQPEAAAATAER